METLNNSFYVYTHSRKTDGYVFYVGKGSGKRAFIKHGRSTFWNNVAKKHGVVVTIIKDQLSEAEAFDFEIELVNYYRVLSGDKLVNITDGGEGSTGLKHSEEFKQYMSNLHKGKKRVFSDEHIAHLNEAQAKRIGQKLSEETKQKMRESHQNRPPVSDVTRQRISEALKGKKHSEERIEKMRSSLTGKKLSEETKAKLSLIRKGKTKPPEVVAKMVAARKLTYERKRNEIRQAV